MAIDISNYLANQPSSGLNADGTSATDQALNSGKKNIASSYTTFLTLLTAQLKNQDPTSPLDTNNFTQQLTQMTGVQQQLLSNELLQKLVNQDSSGFGAVGLIGKTATAAGSDAQLANGKADWAYSLPAGAVSGTLSVTDASGKVIWTGAAPDITAGRHPFQWDGKDSNGNTVPDGVYKLKVAATDGKGEAMTTTAYQIGLVSSIEQVDGVTLVKIGPSKLPLSAITEVS